MNRLVAMALTQLATQWERRAEELLSDWRINEPQNDGQRAAGDLILARAETWRLAAAELLKLVEDAES